MAEQVSFEVLLEAQTRNFDVVEKALVAIQDVTSALMGQSKELDKDLQRVFKNVEKLLRQTADAAKDFSQATKEAKGAAVDLAQGASEGVDSFKALQQEISETTKRLQELAREHVGAGGREPYKMALRGMSEEEARKIIAADEATGVSALTAARRRVSAADQIRAAQQGMIKVSEEVRLSTLSEIDAVNQRIEAAKKEQASLRGKVGANVRHGNVEQEAAARQKLLSTTKEIISLEEKREAILKKIAEEEHKLAVQRSQDAQAAAETVRQGELAAMRNFVQEGGSPTGTVAKGQDDLNRATQGATGALKDQRDQLPRLRYALYDVAHAFGIVSATLTALGGAAIYVSAQYESAFAAVQRTSGVTGDAVDKLRDDFLQLSREIPQSFEELTNIGARGAQLGVATDALSDFTDTVAKFVATSDTVTLDEAVESFGRISNLLGDTDFSRIGSAITKVGVNVAATEAQIVRTTQELAPFATAVGMSTDEVVGLAAAVASLGQPPERARSAFLTLQRVMDTALVSGTEQLGKFGRLLGMTADQVADLWKTDPSEFIASFSNALGSVENLTLTFQELGIHERRAIQVFQALAADARNAGDGLSVLDTALAESAQGYEENTEMARQFAIIMDTLAAKWQIFQNAVKEFNAAVGDVFIGTLKFAVDIATWLVNGLTEISKNPAGKSLIVLVGILGTVTAAFTGLVATIALILASVAAMNTAVKSLGIDTTKSLGPLKLLREAFRQVSTSANTATASVGTFDAATQKATVSIRGMTTALRVLRTVSWVGVGLSIVALAWEGITYNTKKAQRAFDEYIGTTAGLQDAVSADTAAFKEAEIDKNQEVMDSYLILDSKLKDVDEAYENHQRQLDNTRAVLGVQERAVRDVKDGVEDLTIAIGKNTNAWIVNELMSKPEARERLGRESFRDIWDEVGGNFEELLDKMSGSETIEAARETGKLYIQNLLDAMQEELDRDIADFYDKTGDYSQFLPLDLQERKDQLDGVRGTLDEVVDSVVVVYEETRELSNAAHVLGVELDGTSDSIEDFGNELEDALKEITEATRRINDIEGAIFNLGSTLGENGDQWNEFTDAGRRNIGAVLDAVEALHTESQGDMDAFASNMQALYEFLIEGAFATEQQLGFLRSMIESLAGSSGVVASDRSFISFYEGWSSGAERAAKSTRSAGRALDEMRDKMKTVTDYANELSKVWGRAFDIRFSGQQSLDAIASSFISIRDAADQAARRIRDLTNDIAGLESDINIQEYFLSIALEYGDTQRAAAIEADLAKKRADLADKNKSLQEEQVKANKSLVGNNAAAIENRKTILGLVKQYQDHIKALADSGASQSDLAKATEQLKQDFMAQATQLGFNQQELGVYAAAFDDVSAAISRVPRDVTVEIRGLDPAKAALKEFEAAVQDAMRRARAAANKPITPKVDDSALQRSRERLELQSKLDHALKMQAQQRSGPDAKAWAMMVESYSRQLKALGSYYTGGFTGRGGYLDVAGAAHRGEYVIPKRDVNQATGMPTMDALGRLMQGSMGRYNMRQSAGLGGGNGVVSLSPGSVQALAKAVQPYLVLDSQVIARATSSAYSENTTVGAN